MWKILRENVHLNLRLFITLEILHRLRRFRMTHPMTVANGAIHAWFDHLDIGIWNLFRL